MRRFLSKAFIFLGVLSLVLGTINSFGHSISYAEDLELIGTNLGLEVIPSGSKLFDLNKLNPGDREEAKITIKNNYSSPFHLYMRAERMSPTPEEGEVDLFKQLNLTVYLRGNIVYSGSMKDFATSNISLGVFKSNDIEDLRAVVHLPGLETGNEFQGSGVDVKWIFIASADAPPEPPQPPEPETPIPPTTSSTPSIPEEPEVIIDEEVPEAVPEVPEETIEDIPEDIPEDIVEEPMEEEVIEEDIPQDVPRMPKTGEISTNIFYGAGMLFLLLGIELGFKKKK